MLLEQILVAMQKKHITGHNTIKLLATITDRKRNINGLIISGNGDLQ